MKDGKDPEDWDDGRTVAPMDSIDRPSLSGLFRCRKKKKEGREELDITKKEKRSMTKAAFAVLLPRFLLLLLGFGIAIVVVAFWLL